MKTMIENTKKIKIVKSLVIRAFLFLWEIIYVLPLFFISVYARFRKKRIDVGLGPEPLINNVYHKRALNLYGYSAETFVDAEWHITGEFDVKYIYKNKYASFLLLKIFYIDFINVVLRYKAIYIYFNGCSLRRTQLIWRLEPYLLKLGKVKIVVMPYGSDIQLLEYSKNLYFKHAQVSDYPSFKNNHVRISLLRDLWTEGASYVISGCEWVDYMYHWDKLLVGHFSIDLNRIDIIANQNNISDRAFQNSKPFRILHAPNHKSIKGSKFVISAVEKLVKKGHNVELVLVEKKSNHEIINLILEADLIIDQLVIGWYAMFAIEAMALSKPVICYLREDLLSFYRYANLIHVNEPPLINANPANIEEVIESCLLGVIDLSVFSSRGREYVQRIHSIEFIGEAFNEINSILSIKPSLL
jgi:hypothetical protein